MDGSNRRGLQSLFRREPDDRGLDELPATDEVAANEWLEAMRHMFFLICWVIRRTCSVQCILSYYILSSNL